MGYELDKLMRSLGVSTTSLLPYAGEENKPAKLGENATADEIRAYNDKMAKYIADKDAYDQYQSNYRERVSSGSPYTQAQYQPTRRLQTSDIQPAQAPVRDVPWDETPVTLGARPPVNYVSSNAPTFDRQMNAPRYGRLPAPSEGLSAVTEMAGATGSDPYYIAIQRYLKDHTPEEAKAYFNASDFDISRAKQFVAPTNEWNPSFVGPHVDLPNNIEDALFRGGNPPSTNTGPSTTPFGTLPTTEPGPASPMNAISIQKARNALIQMGTPYGKLPGATIHGPQEMANTLGVAVNKNGVVYTPENTSQTPAQIPSGPLTIEQARTFLTNQNIPFGKQEGAVVRGPQAMADYFNTPIVKNGVKYVPGGKPPITPGMPAGPLTTAAQNPVAKPAVQPPTFTSPLNLSPEILANIRRATGLNFAHGGPVHMQGGGFMDGQEQGDQPSLQEMWAAYQGAIGPSSYAEDIKAAREKAAAQQEELLDSLKNAAGSDSGSKAEMWFRLASALGQPTRTGTFGETIGNVGQAMAESAKAGRERQMAQRQLALEAQKIRAGTAKEELETLQGLSSEEMKTKRDFVGKMIEEQFNLGKGKSELAKLAMDLTGKPITHPETQAKLAELVAQKEATSDIGRQATESRLRSVEEKMDLERRAQALKEEEADRKRKEAKAKASKLSPTEIKAKDETTKTIRTINQQMKNLERAFELNKDAYGGDVMDRLRKGVSSLVDTNDPKYIAAQERDNILLEVGGSAIKEIFGGAPSEFESKIATGLSGATKLSSEEKNQIMIRAIQRFAQKRKELEQQLAEITSGKWGEKNIPAEEESTNAE